MSQIPEALTPLPASLSSGSKSQTLFWNTFLVMLFIPLIGSAISPLPFALFVPLIGIVFFPLHKILFGNFPLLRTPLPGLLPFVVTLLILMLASTLWSVNPDATFERALKVGGLIIASFGMISVAQSCPQDIWRKHSLLFPFAVMTLGLVTILDLYGHMPFYRFLNQTDTARGDLLNKNSSVFVMAFPVALYLAWKSRSLIFTVALLFLAVITLLMTSSQACQMALLVIAIGSFGCLFFLEKITMRTAFLGMAFLFLMLPWMAPTAFDLLAAKINESEGVLSEASTSLRLENWDFLARRILENPWTGFGMDSTRYMKFDTQQLYFHNDSIMHPHNAALQMWIEFGVLGAGWAIAFLIYFYAALRKMQPHTRRLSFITFTAIMVFLLVSWSIWASWLVALSLYLAGLCVLATKDETKAAQLDLGTKTQ